jgi:hypothetical protein
VVQIHSPRPIIYGPARRHGLHNVPDTWVTPRIALSSRIKVCCAVLLLSLVCQIARIFPGPVDHSASNESLYELRIVKFFGNNPEAPPGSKF